MRIALVVCVLAPAIAAAQPGMTPYYQPSPDPVVAPAPETKAHFDIGLIAASPRGDWKDSGAQTSPGLHVQLGIAVSPTVSVFGGLRYVSLKFDQQAGVPADAEISDRELQLGLRFVSPVSPAAKFFLEGNIHATTVSVDYQGTSDSASGGGLGVRGGLIFMASRTTGIGIAASYTSSAIEPSDGGDKFDDSQVAGDAFVSFGF